MRSLVLASLIAASGCATVAVQPTLREVPQRTWEQHADPRCGPIAVTRPALGSTWGEYLRVTVTAPFAVEGDARVHVGSRPEPLTHYDARANASTPTTVAEFHWERRRVASTAAIPTGRAVVLSLSPLAGVETRDCSAVRYTIEQGALQPTVSDSLWLAELAKRPQPAGEVDDPTEVPSAANGPTFAQLDAAAVQTGSVATTPTVAIQAEHRLGGCRLVEAPQESSTVAWLGGTATTEPRPRRLSPCQPEPTTVVETSANVTVAVTSNTGSTTTREDIDATSGKTGSDVAVHGSFSANVQTEATVETNGTVALPRAEPALAADCTPTDEWALPPTLMTTTATPPAPSVVVVEPEPAAETAELDGSATVGAFFQLLFQVAGHVAATQSALPVRTMHAPNPVHAARAATVNAPSRDDSHAARPVR